MRKSLLFLILVVILSVCLVPGMGLAKEFVFPPENNAPDWQTTFPYQRNIYWDFSTNPTATPPHYEGYLDDMLKDSDYVELWGDVGWNPDLEAIGIGDGGSGYAIFHLDNLVDQQPIKHLYLEATFKTNSSLLFWGYSGKTPDGYEVVPEYSGAFFTQLDQDTWQVNMWLAYVPNPPWEEYWSWFEANPGEYYWLLDMHIATESVPLPSTLFLFGSALAGLAGMRRVFNPKNADMLSDSFRSQA